MPTHTVRSGQRPAARTEYWDWQLQARCRRLGTASFFAPDGETAGERARRERRAKQICSSCDVRPQCLAHAMQISETYGVWGGTTERQRKRDRRPTGNRGPACTSLAVEHLTQPTPP
ncbi:WhiB family transcriptional regulator [Rhodococcus opacus]|uniref:WhiB family transcriptional regulator n=1 Tax=Rhodococcus opacus TaxID=37919 RepID=UPI0009EBBC88|nr:WhiB family transcriptional regulator [Rhodococcus opacus]